MPFVYPTVENIEAYLQHVEEVVVTSLSQAAPDLPSIQQVVQRVQEDLARFWPQSLAQLPDIKMPNLGPFEVPPPPPPPPAPRSLFEKSADWVGEHPWKTAGIGFGLVGAGLLAGYGRAYFSGSVRTRRLRTAGAAHDGERRQVVVVLGGDSPQGIPLILELEKSGYIVIASVCTPEAVEEVEKQTHGFVRAIVLDPSEPETIPFFFRSLASTMNRRFPLSASGDPHSSPSTQPWVHCVVSLLTLPSAQSMPEPGPIENLGMQDVYPAYLQATHFTPLQVIQGLLPLMRNSAARTRDAVANNHAKKSIIFCLPATDARVGLPFAGAQAMSAAATLRGAEVLRREIRLASMTEDAHTMKNIKVVVVDVGSVGAVGQRSAQRSDATHGMIDWTASEKAAYGPAFSSALEGGAAARRPDAVSKFVATILDIVGGGRGPQAHKLARLDRFLGRLREFIRGDRVIVGAGARTYALAANLPALILDALLNLPTFLISIRNAMLPVPPRVALPYPPPAPPAARVQSRDKPTSSQASVDSDPEHDAASDNGSDADVESSGYGSGVGESWISLQKDGVEHP